MSMNDRPLTSFLVVVPGVVLACVLGSLHVQHAVVANAQETSLTHPGRRVDVDPMVALTLSTLRQCLAEPGQLPTVSRTLRPEPVWLELSRPDALRPTG